MIEISKIKKYKDKIDYLDEVLSLSIEAHNYLLSFNWCNQILNGWLVKEWGYIVCIFYFEIEPHENSGADNFVWVIVGDIPPAYIDIQSAKNACEVLGIYVQLMEEWIFKVKCGESVSDCFPINIEPTIQHADMLYNRVKIIKEDLIPECRKSSKTLEG